MKTQFKTVCLVLLVLCPVYLYGQNHPELDVATSFAIYKNGQNIFVEYTPFQEIMGTPDVIEEIDGGGIHLQYGSSKFWFILGYYSHEQPHLYYIELKDAGYRVNINGVDIHVGDLAYELAEHFPKSWAVKLSDQNPETRDYLSIEVNEVEFIDILISSNGVVQSIIYWMRLT
ncbi:MAG: hypothetical protein LAT57_09290 [Balneolales bacterium]|nr:hypothetical protein [Balneolales bacterium]